MCVLYHLAICGQGQHHVIHSGKVPFFFFSSSPLQPPPSRSFGGFSHGHLELSQNSVGMQWQHSATSRNAAGMLPATNPIRPMERSFGGNGKVVVVYGSGSCTISANGPWGCCLCRSGHQLASRLTVEGCIYLPPLGPMVRGISWGWCAKPTLYPLFSINCRPRFGSVGRNWATTCQSERGCRHKARQHLLVGTER